VRQAGNVATTPVTGAEAAIRCRYWVPVSLTIFWAVSPLRVALVSFAVSGGAHDRNRTSPRPAHLSDL